MWISASAHKRRIKTAHTLLSAAVLQHPVLVLGPGRKRGRPTRRPNAQGLARQVRVSGPDAATTKERAVHSEDIQLSTEGSLQGNRISGWPMRTTVPSRTFSHSAKPLGANTMIVEPCSNQPISWPLLNAASHET